MSVHKLIFFALISTISSLSINVEAQILINSEVNLTEELTVMPRVVPTMMPLVVPQEDLTVMPRVVPQYGLAEIYNYCGYNMADAITNTYLDIDKHLIEVKDDRGQAFFVLSELYLIRLHKEIGWYEGYIQERLAYLESVKNDYKGSPYAQQAFEEAEEVCSIAMGEFIAIQERYPILL